MERRDFLKATMLASILYGSGFGMGFSKALAASTDRYLLNLVLSGGPDFRHLIVPPYDANPGSVGYTYWSNRWSSHGIANTETAWKDRWNNDYDQVSLSGSVFGVLKKAGWLKAQISAGNVALCNNVYASKTRDHSHSLLKLESGDLNTGPNSFARNGWGGRLAEQIDANVCSMTNQVRLFCHGVDARSDQAHNNARVVSAKDTRNMALNTPDTLKDDSNSTRPRAVMSRALTSYYEAKRGTISEDSPHYPIIQHEKTYRDLGGAIDTLLAANPTPAAIEALFDGDSKLNSTYFGRQIRNTYDCFLASDVLDFRIASLEYGGWDSHKDQVATIEPKIEDIFGTGKGLDSLFTQMKSDMNTKYNNTTMTIAGEFGRQLKANGDQGTDHGRGMTVLVIGPQVKGGVYGDIFPSSEIAKFEKGSPDIDGQTSIEQVFGSVCEWTKAGSKDLVFPNVATSDLEAGVSFDGLMS